MTIGRGVGTARFLGWPPIDEAFFAPSCVESARGESARRQEPVLDARKRARLSALGHVAPAVRTPAVSVHSAGTRAASGHIPGRMQQRE